MPVISSFDNANVGLVTHAVVSKVLPKSLVVEFYNNLRAVVPRKEARCAMFFPQCYTILQVILGSETGGDLSSSFSPGNVVKVCITVVDIEEQRLVASIRRAAHNSTPFNQDLSSLEISNIVQGIVHEIQNENVVLCLVPSNVRALISVNNLANHRSVSPSQLQATLKAGDKLDHLVVVTRNVEKGFVIVANKPDNKRGNSSATSLSIDSVNVGQIVQGRVTRHTPHGTLVKLTSHIGGILYPTDTSDNYDTAPPYPVIDTIIRAAVVEIDHTKKQLVLSTRRSKLFPTELQEVIDREISGIDDLRAGDSVRGFVKNIMDHGLFVTIGRRLDARVQIRELFDDVCVSFSIVTVSDWY